MSPHDVRERWVPIATAPGGDPGRSLQPIYDVLEAAGIPAGFDPYRPGDASSPYPYMQRAFHVVVPESQRGIALKAVREAGIRIPGESDPAAGPADFEPTFSGDHSDRVLDEDLEIDRLARRRRVLVGGVAAFLVLAFGYSLFRALFTWFQTGLFD